MDDFERSVIAIAAIFVVACITVCVLVVRHILHQSKLHPNSGPRSRLPPSTILSLLYFTQSDGCCGCH